jgi:hypothetical protein
LAEVAISPQMQARTSCDVVRAQYDVAVNPAPTRRRHVVSFEAESSTIPSERIARIESTCMGLHRITVAVLRGKRIRGFSLRVILTGDLVTTVRRVSPPMEEYPRLFIPNRLGGIVTGKMLLPNAEGDPFTIILSDAAWTDDDDEATAHGIAIIAHELGHCAIEMCRRASGYAPSTTDLTMGESVAREIARDALEEYRVGQIENALLSAVGTSGKGDDAVPLALHHLYGDDYVRALGETLTGVVYPGWPDRVQTYRDWNISMEDMWEGLARSAWEAFVLIAHAAAVARSADEPDPITGEFAGSPAVSLYLGEPWERMLDIADTVSVLCTPAASAKMEERIYTEGVDALLAMFGELGLRFTLRPGGRQHLAVTAPARLRDDYS